MEDITRRREDITFIFESWKQHFTHVIDIFTSEDMENISLCIFQYLTLYYKMNIIIWTLDNGVLLETETLVELIRHYIRDLQVRVFSVFHPR
jgi:hypothetical protein